MGVSVYKAGRSVPLDSAQLDLSRLALHQLGSAGVEKCFEIHVPSSALKTQKTENVQKCISRIESERSLPICCRMWSAKRRPEFAYLLRVFQTLRKANIDFFFLHDGMLHDWVRQETTEIHVPSSGLKTQQNGKTSKNAIHE